MILPKLLQEVSQIMYRLLNNRLIIIVISVLILFVGSCLYFYHKGLEEKTIPIQPIRAVTHSDIKSAQINAGKYKSDRDVVEVTRIIEKETKRPADVQFVTHTQQEADHKAEALAKKNKSDYVLKETKTDSDTNMINNNFYAIKQEKSNRIGVGVAVVDHDTYLTAHYQHNRLRIDAYKGIRSSSSKLDGVGMSYDLVKF